MKPSQRNFDHLNSDKDDKRSSIYQFSGGKNSSSYEPFIGRGLSEIRKFDEIYEDGYSDNNTIARIRDVLWDEQENYNQQDDYIRLKKPRSQLISNLPGMKVELPQSPKNKSKDPFDAVNTPQRKNKHKMIEFKSEKQPSSKQKCWDNVPEQQIVKLKELFTSSKNQISEIILRQKQQYNITEVKEYQQALDDILSKEKGTRKQFSKYFHLGSIIRDSISSTELNKNEKAYLQKLAQVEQKVCSLISFEKGQQFQNCQTNWNSPGERLHFMKKDEVLIGDTFKAKLSRYSRSRGSSKSSSSRSKSKQNVMLNEFKSLFSSQSQAKHQTSISKGSIRKQLIYSSKLKSLLTMDPLQIKDSTKLTDGGSLKAFIELRSSKIAKQKVMDYLESKKLLYKMVSDKYQDNFWWLENSQSKNLDEENSEKFNQPKLLLKNIKPQYINASYLKYKSQKVNEKNVEQLNIIPENCQVLHFMKNPPLQKLSLQSKNSHRKINLSINPLSSLKVSQNIPNDINQNNQMCLQNDEPQKSANRISRDFSPPKQNKMTYSAMIPNNNHSNNNNDKSSDLTQEQDTFNDQVFIKTFKSTNQNAKFQKKNATIKSMFRSINLKNTAKQQHVFAPIIPAKPNKKELYRQAYELYKPSGDIDIMQFYEQKILQKCDEYVESRINKNNKKSYNRNFDDASIQSMQQKQDTNLFIIPSERQIKQFEDQNMNLHEQKAEQLMNLFSSKIPRPIEQPQNEQQEDQIKQMLKLGKYRQIKPQVQIKKCSKKQDENKGLPDSSSKLHKQTNLGQYLQQCQQNQKNFRNLVEKQFKSYAYDSKDIVDFEKIAIVDKTASQQMAKKEAKKQSKKKVIATQGPSKVQKTTLTMKKAISQDESDTQELQSEERLPTFVVSAEEIKVQPIEVNKNPVVQKSSPSKQVQKQIQQKPASVKTQKLAPPQLKQQASQPPTQPSKSKQQTPPISKPPSQTNPPLNIFEQNKYKPNKDLFQQQGKPGFGQGSNIFSQNQPQQQSNQTVFTQNAPPQFNQTPQFTSFNPQQFQQAFQPQQNSMTFANFQSQDNNNVNQQISQQLAQNFASMPKFESFGPAAFGNGQGPNFGSNVFNSNSNQQQPMSPATMNPLNIMHQQANNIFPSPQQKPPTSNYFQPRK